MYSVHHGWKNNIDPIIISHPANCEIMFGIENIRKRTNSSISIEELVERIKNW
jgi:hypothetical protein